MVKLPSPLPLGCLFRRGLGRGLYEVVPDQFRTRSNTEVPMKKIYKVTLTAMITRIAKLKNGDVLVGSRPPGGCVAIADWCAGAEYRTLPPGNLPSTLQSSSRHGVFP